MKYWLLVRKSDGKIVDVRQFVGQPQPRYFCSVYRADQYKVVCLESILEEYSVRLIES